MMKKIFFLFILFFILQKEVYNQIDTFSVQYLYSKNSINLLLKNKLDVNYKNTDTLTGYEIRYYYFINGENNRCLSYIYFAKNNILEYSNLYSVFSHEIVSCQNIESLSPNDFILKGDTFLYENSQNEYEANVLLNGYTISNLLYKVSKFEFCEFYKVHAIVDVFSGDTTSLHSFNPILKNVTFENDLEIFYKYRKILKREPLNMKIILGMKGKKYRYIKKCSCCN